MRILLALLLGLGAVSAAACKSQPKAEMKQSETVTLAISGMT